MNSIIQKINNVSMTSLEIAELTGKEHRSVTRDIEVQLGKVCPLHKFVQSYTADNGHEYKMYRLPRREVLILVSGYSVELRARIIDRLDELEDIVRYGKVLPRNYTAALKALAETAEENERLALENKSKDQIIGELKPKADYTDRILKSKGTVPITPIAKDYGMSGMRFNHLLHELGVQYRQGDMWLLYSRYQGCGYTHSKTFDYTDNKGCPQTRMITAWTQKGRLFLYNLLKEHGYYPLIEKPKAI